MNTIRRSVVSCLPVLMLVAPAARAQFAVIDMASITQLISQARTLEEQLVAARDQFVQAQAQLQSMTGTRGMERLLSGTDRNYLPADWPTLMAATQSATASFGTLAADVQQAVAANAVLSDAQLAGLAANDRAQIVAARQSTGTLQALVEASLANSSGRFASLQQLIDAIPTATDEKGILELNARIGAEHSMLQNEQTKLQVLFQAAQAQDWANRQRERELAVAEQGSFATRFEPSVSP